MKIRTATMADLAAVAAVEKACFPPAEAATADEFRDRLAHYAAHFWLLFDDKGDLVSFVDGMVTDERDLTDAMYAQAAMHDEKGAWQMIFGVNTLPSCRRHGYAGKLLEAAMSLRARRSRSSPAPSLVSSPCSACPRRQLPAS